MIQNFEDAVLKVAMWWSDKSFRTPLNQNNGDDGLSGAFTFLLMNRIAMEAIRTVSDEQKKVFEEELGKLIIQKRKSYLGSILLNVDYQPCEILNAACNLAKIKTCCLPCKSASSIDINNVVTVKYQYGGNWMEL